MKKILNLFIVMLLAFSFTACEDYLNEPKPTDQLTAVDIYASREGVEAYLSGIYRKFRSQHSSTTDVGGIYSMYFARTIKGNDLIQKRTWYLYDYAHDNREPTYRRVRETWNLLYDLVDHANTMIGGIEESNLSDADKTELIAHGKALRAYFYFQLVLEYQAGYPSVGTGAIAPPLYLMSTVEPNGMSTMGEIYEQILTDINDAIAGLSEDRLGKSYINRSVANGIKARVLMAMDQNWAEVATAANSAYGGNAQAALMGEYDDGFDDIENPEWLWGLDQQDDQTNYYYAAPHAFIDHYEDGYYGTYMNSDFVAQFTETDIRNTFNDTLYKVDEGDYRQFVTTKFAFAFTSDIPTMRTAEMILAESEALYREAKESDAHDLLFVLQSNRDTSVAKSSNTGAALLEEILLERRKELYGEIGVEWFDAKRLQRGITRTGNHRVMVTLEPNDTRFFLKIPQTEIDANPNISDDVNDNR